MKTQQILFVSRQQALPIKETVMFRRQAGVTLVELVVTIVILSIALVGLSIAISGGLNQSANTLFEVRAIALGQSYLDEILSKKFDERSRNSGIPPCKDPTNGALSGRKCSAAIGLDTASGPNEIGFARKAFDDVDDFNGLDEGFNSAGGDPLLDAQGNARSGYDNYRVQVVVRLIDTTGGGGEEFSATSTPKPNDSYDAKLITVTVSDGSAAGLSFSAYKSNF
jgi:MSHA pilin protein MshD